jgi:hypothetical protein
MFQQNLTNTRTRFNSIGKAKRILNMGITRLDPVEDS